ncbi:MAG: murein hydrolase activator EnvC family protein [Flavobacteriales bacterium]|jgi:septal ring factor EnvC (AmiA/AmiB activator)|tara:strand:+ start:3156 stop:4376 length:1221 start_codon:yes stop_codon:yes gene_type:complete
MTIQNRLQLGFFLFIVAFNLQSVLAQKSNRSELETKKNQIQKEIKAINEMLFDNKKKKAVVFTDIENLTYKIQRKEELVKLTNQQINLLDNESNLNISQQLEMETQLEEVKEAYGEMISKSYKTKSGKNRLMFLLSSETFFQAFKRIQYIKQYSTFRKNQAIKITLISNQLKTANELLTAKKNEKEQLVFSNREVQKSLEKEKKKINTIAYELRKKEKKYKREIIQKQLQTTKIDKEIEKLIREAIARSNKNNSRSKSFNLTPEAKALAKKFVLNKGKLPWPVIRGVVIQKFGTQPHPVVKTAKIKSNGIVIATPKFEKVKTVFEGTVLSVLQFKGSNPTVLIQHGNYISAYKNLSKVYVKKGDVVSSGQEIGQVFTNNSTGRSTIQFSLFEKTTPMNPLLWILKM